MDKCTELIQKVYNERKQYFYALAYLRHLNDMKNLDPEVFRFNEKKALLYVATMELFKHYKGEKAGTNFVLEDWQKAMIYIIAGWEYKNSEGIWVRRFNNALYLTSRKSGKSFIASALGLAESIISPEKGQEVCSAATMRDQAKIVWDGFRHFILSNKHLKKRFKKRGYELTDTTKNNKIYCVGRDASSLDGLNISFLVLDELHAWKDGELKDVLSSSMGSRRNPFTMIVSTAGFFMGSPLLAEVDHAKAILTGEYEDNHYFAFLAIPDKEPEFSKDALLAANPNLGISVSWDFMERELENAKQRPELRVNYLTKYENRFVGASEEFIPLDDWKKTEFNPDDNNMDLDSTRKILGLDLSVNDDFTALCELDVFSDQTMYASWKFWNVSEGIEERQRYLRAPITTWAEMGYIELQNRKAIFLDPITDHIYSLMEDNDTILAYDPFRAKEVINKLINRGIEEERLIPVSQGFRSNNEALLKLVNALKHNKLKHEKNPVMNWMVSNVEVQRDSYGNVKIDRSKKIQKIDGVAALLNSIYVAIPLLEEEEDSGEIEVYWV